MQTLRIKTPSTDDVAGGTPGVRAGPGRGLPPLLAGAATGVGAAGALLALTDSASPLRAPCTLSFLLMAPTVAIAAALRGLDPFARTLCALAGSVVVNMLVAQGMLAVHRWSIRGGVATVTVLSLLLLLLTLARERISGKYPQKPTT
ncbi:hypothetical protein [Streptomyces pluripotens]|uniref:hypothetical protein n=2 Tax=Streptomyces TaxID=1883 RepID=UPI0005802049|nr:hypothetical protein [Streptomyces pluripotens]ARP69481.1 hypothetical protein LK06_005440 [Streptomyces pluripotens]